MRPEFCDIYMQLAFLMAQRSTCRRVGSNGDRMQVGTVIASTDGRYVFGVGYNGNAAGEPHGCDTDEPGACGCLHAEENAVINCREHRSEPKFVYATHMPCKACAKRLVNMGGVKHVFYSHSYRLTDGIELLLRRGVTVSHYVPPVEA